MNKVAKNFIYNITGNIGSKILSFVVLLFTARVFGSSIFGEVNSATAEYSYFSMFALCGMNGYGLFLLSKASTPEEKRQVINEVSSVKAISGLIAAVAIIVYALLPQTHDYVWPFFFLLLLQQYDTTWVFNALQDMKLSAYASMITIPINAGILLILYFCGIRNVYTLLFANIISILVLYAVFTYYLKKRHDIKIEYVKPKYFSYIKKAFPYMASGIFAGINANIDIVILGYTVSSSEVGYYSANYKLINEFVAMCAVVFTPFFPVFVEKIAKKEMSYVNRVTGQLRTILMAVILPCTIVGVFYAKEILGFLYGTEFEAGATAFAILMVFVALLYYRELYGYILTADGQQSNYLKVVMVSGTCNIILNLLLIPKFGIAAAAFTTLISEIINLVGMRRFVKKSIPFAMENYNLHRLIIPLATMIACIIVMKVFNIYFIITAAVACIIYAILLFVCKVIDIDVIKGMLKKG